MIYSNLHDFQRLSGLIIWSKWLATFWADFIVIAPARNTVVAEAMSTGGDGGSLGITHTNGACCITAKTQQKDILQMINTIHHFHTTVQWSRTKH